MCVHARVIRVTMFQALKITPVDGTCLGTPQLWKTPASSINSSVFRPCICLDISSTCRGNTCQRGKVDKAVKI